MNDFEKLGLFYLGKSYDAKSKTVTDDAVLYSSKDLTTHAVCVGMTGSGKTGLCISLLEEAAIDNIPAIIIDPKGDITNLMLTFPNLTKEEFLPWVNESEAVRKNVTIDDYAETQARLWENGLAEWGQGKERIHKLKSSADFAIYTPGSSAGRQLSIIDSFKSPSKDTIEDIDLFADRISSIVTSLLGLIGIDADPLKSKEHILLSNIIQEYWSQSKDLDLPTIIQLVQNPPFSKIGVFDLDVFYPQKERLELAMLLNNILSAPGFQSWLQGESFSIDSLLYGGDARPNISILYIAHLSEAERMFFISLLLNQMLSWMRSQSGTTSLRAILYIDELFGFMPPVSNPPSKKPLLTLLKQARAFGLGIVVATQNPVDLDYKSLSNAGTWFIGRLQTEQDVNRIIDGLEGASSSEGAKFNKKEIENLLAGLDKRVFLLHNVHEGNPILFKTRWALSYLRGPLTRNQIRQLSENDTKSNGKQKVELKNISVTQSKIKNNQPILHENIEQFFIKRKLDEDKISEYVYHPFILSSAKVYFIDKRNNIDEEKEITFIHSINDDIVAVKWDDHLKVNYDLSQLEKSPINAISFSSLPDVLKNNKIFSEWEKEFKNFIYTDLNLELLKSNLLNEISKPSETRREFMIRLNQKSREIRDEMTDKLKEKYEAKFRSIENKIRTAEERIEREKTQASAQTVQTAISVGTTILGALFGSKVFSSGTASKAGTAMRSANRSLKERKDVELAEEKLELLQKELHELQNRFNEEVSELNDKLNSSAEEIESVKIRPQKTNIIISFFNLVWIPIGNERLIDIENFEFL